MSEVRASMQSLVGFIRKQPVDRPTLVSNWGPVVLSEYIREELGVKIPLMAYPYEMSPFLTQLISETKNSGLITSLMKPQIPSHYGGLIFFMTTIWPETARFL